MEVALSVTPVVFFFFFNMNKYQAGQPSVTQPSRRLWRLITSRLDMAGESAAARILLEDEERGARDGGLFF